MNPPKSIPSDIWSAMTEAAFGGGVPRASVDALAKKLGATFPGDFAEFLTETNGGSFSLGDSYANLYDIARILDEHEQRDDDFPSFLRVFGDNSGDERYAFDLRTNPHPIVVVPHHQPEDDDILPQGTTLTSLLTRMMNDQLFK